MFFLFSVGHISHLSLSNLLPFKCPNIEYNWDFDFLFPLTESSAHP